MSEKYRDMYRIPSARLQRWDYGWNATYFVTICTAHRERYFGEIVNGIGAEPPTMQLSEIGDIAQQCWQEIPNHFPFIMLDAFVVMPNHVHGIIIINKPDGPVETPNLGVSIAPPCPNDTLSVADISILNAETPRLGVPMGISNFGNTMDVVDVPKLDSETPMLGIPMGFSSFGNTMDAVDVPKLDAETPMLGVSTKNVSVDNGIGSPKSTGGKNDKWESGTLGVIINQYKRACTINARKIHADFAWQTRFHDHIIRSEESFQRIRSYIAGNTASWEADKLYGYSLP